MLRVACLPWCSGASSLGLLAGQQTSMRSAAATKQISAGPEDRMQVQGRLRRSRSAGPASQKRPLAAGVGLLT